MGFAMLRSFWVAGVGVFLAAGMAQVAPPNPGTPSPASLHHEQVAVRIVSRISSGERANLQKFWVLQLRKALRANWKPLVPDTNRPPMTQLGTTVLDVRVTANGLVRHMALLRPSGDPALDHAAEGAVKAATPLPPFPPSVDVRTLALRLTFRYL